jgi:HD superfamily phosphodiesterase
LSHTSHDIGSLDDDTDDRAHSHIGYDLWIKWFRHEVCIVLIECRLRKVEHLKTDDLKITIFDASDDASDERTVNDIGLEKEERTFCHRKIEK